MSQDLLRSLPAVSKLLTSSVGRDLCGRYGEGLVKFFVRQRVEEIRSEIQSNERSAVPDIDELVDEVIERLERLTNPQARHAINATGVLLHTGLGRAPLGGTVLEAVAAGSGFGVVQINLADNSRSLREEKIQQMLIELTGCEAATLVNNNAAATFMLLHIISAGGEVILSRGQMVEIGGSYRMPDVMEQSGAVMREVGTTNKTHLYDYERAINENTAAIIYVEPSNYCVQGFAGYPSLEELCNLGQKHKVPVIADLGCGALVPMAQYGLKKVITIADAISAGAAITCSSGDKLIGGPQAGIICGRADLVQRVRKSPFMRMFRTDKLTLAGTEATIAEFVAGTQEQNLPLYQMLSVSQEQLRSRAQTLVARLKPITNISCTIAEDTSYVGGGSLPTEAIPTIVVEIRTTQSDKQGDDADVYARMLRLSIPPVFCRIHEGQLVFDMRTLFSDDLDRLSAVLLDVFSEAE